jgi:hypothetical protein
MKANLTRSHPHLLLTAHSKSAFKRSKRAFLRQEREALAYHLCQAVSGIGMKFIEVYYSVFELCLNSI